MLIPDFVQYFLIDILFYLRKLNCKYLFSFFYSYPKLYIFLCNLPKSISVFLTQFLLVFNKICFKSKLETIKGIFPCIIGEYESDITKERHNLWNMFLNLQDKHHSYNANFSFIWKSMFAKEEIIFTYKVLNENKACHLHWSIN